MTRELALVVALCACGRIGFPTLEGGDGGGGGVDGDVDAAPCTVPAWSPTVTRLANLSVGNGVEDWEPAVTPDGLTIVFASYRTSSDSSLYISTRATPNDDFAPPTLIPGFGSDPGGDVFGPAWSLDGMTLYFTGPVPSEVDYLGNGQFGVPRASGIPGHSIVFAGPDEIYGMVFASSNDYDLARFVRVAGVWEERQLPSSYNRQGQFLNDAWPSFDRGRRQLYFEHEDSGNAFIVRAQVDASGMLPMDFETLAVLGDDLGDPDISPDGLRMYAASRRRDGTDNDIYMFERTCE